MKKTNVLLECDPLSQNGAEPQSVSPTASMKPDSYQPPGTPGPSGDGPGKGVKSAQSGGTVSQSINTAADQYVPPGKPGPTGMSLEPAVLLERVASGYVPPRPPGPSGIPHHFAIAVRDLLNKVFLPDLAGLSVFILHTTTHARLRKVAFSVHSPDGEVLFQIVRRFEETGKLYVLRLDKVAIDFDPNNVVSVTVETSVDIEGATVGIASIHKTFN